MCRIRADKIFKKIQEEEKGLEQAELDVKARKRYIEKLRKELREVNQGGLFDET
jgi:hypothetical protein